MLLGAHSLVAAAVVVCIAGVSHGIQDVATPSPRLSLHPTQHALGSPGRQQRVLRLRGGQLGQGGGQTPRGVHSQFKSFVDDNLSADARKEVGYTCLGLGAGLFVLVLIPLPIIGVFMNRTVSRNNKIPLRISLPCLLFTSLLPFFWHAQRDLGDDSTIIPRLPASNPSSCQTPPHKNWSKAPDMHRCLE